MRNIFLTVLVIVCACSNPEVPEDLIKEDKMVDLMIEIHLLESKINYVSVKPVDSTQALYNHLESKLFDQLEITKEQYERSFNYYVDHPDELEKIYEVVVDSLQAMEKIYK